MGREIPRRSQLWPIARQPAPESDPSICPRQPRRCGWRNCFSGVAGPYFVGIDQGAVSVFGNDSHVHEFVHDARHLLGFPCH
ncbi:putative cobalt transporter subunit family protein [Mycobacterium xenopi 3993]|nr:putative cobalt transporter subunit family protein [Mycobacterium xenopi 3993]